MLSFLIDEQSKVTFLNLLSKLVNHPSFLQFDKLFRAYKDIVFFQRATQTRRVF